MQCILSRYFCRFYSSQRRDSNNIGKTGARVDTLLRVIPPSKIVYHKQQKDKEKAKVATELREKRDLITKQKKENEKNARGMGTFQYT